MFAILFLLLLLVDRSNSFPTLNYTISNCYDESTYPLDSSYETNVNNLLPILVSQISTAKHGFFTHKQGSDDQDPAYGLALCRGDLNPNDCHECVHMASDEVMSRCPRARQAVIWKEDCMIQVSNVSLFHLLQVNPYQLLYNFGKATKDVDGWVKLVKSTLSEVASKAASDESGNKFATKEAWVPSMHKYLYTMAQCAPNLTIEDCYECFRAGSSRLEIWLSHRGGIMLTPSCTIRYEVYVFYKNSSEGQLPLQSLAPLPPKDITITS